SAQRLRIYEQLAGRPVAWAYFSDHWFRGLGFPRRSVETIWRNGSVPFVRLMPWSADEQGVPEHRFTLARIAAGAFDRGLARWARAAAATDIPLMVEFGTEVNGDWFPWNGVWNGGAGVGPARFKAAFRHMVGLFRANGARNVTWVFHADAYQEPAAAWNRFENYYPGDEYVDWVGLSVYGAQDRSERWLSFRSALGDAYARAARMTRRPLAILETAVDEQPAHDKAAWIRRAFRALRSGDYPRIRAVSWWDERFPNDGGLPPSDLRINSSQASLDAFRAATADPWFVTRARVVRRPGGCSS
ncbi:MAG: beta-mannanase, partial [Actinobacteria bacterium]|nr:beta-mannanase [Actinomycetota bacterium]